jgi:hypothetical protein
VSAAKQPDAAKSVTLESQNAYDRPAREFARMVQEISPSAVVYARLAEGVLDLWVILDERDYDVERAIAESACELMRTYPDLLFDFMFIEKAAPSASTMGDSGYTLVSPT